MNVQEADHLEIPEGYVATIHDSAGKQLWGDLNYSVTYDGDSEQTTYTGKNLLSGNYGSTTAQGLLHSWDNVFVTFSGETTNTYANLTSGSLDIAYQPGTYTFSITKAPSGYSVRIRFYYDNANHDFSIVDGETSVSFTIPDDATDIKLKVIFLGNLTATTQMSDSFGLMLESGSTPSTFEPYVGGIPAPNPDYPQPISVVKGHQTVTLTGGTLTGDYPLDLIGKNICSSATVRNTFHIDFIIDCANITSNKAVLSAITNADLANSSVYAFVDGVDLHQSAGVFNGEANKRGYATLTFNSTVMAAIQAGKELKLDLYKNGANFSSVSDAQLELGETLTDYTPYYNYELCKVGTYQDSIWKDDDTWKVHNEVGKVVFTNNQNFSYSAGYTNCARFTYDSITTSSLSTNVMSDHFTKGIGGSDTENISINGSSRRIMLTINKSLASNITELGTWLSINNTTVYYLLDTSTDTAISDTTLISQLEAIYDFMKRYGYTSAVSGDLPIIINRIPY